MNVISLYFYTNELVIPAVNEIIDLAEDTPNNITLKDITRIHIDNLLKRREEIVNTINNKDWGLADVFASSLLENTKKLVLSTNNIKVRSV